MRHILHLFSVVPIDVDGISVQGTNAYYVSSMIAWFLFSKHGPNWVAIEVNGHFAIDVQQEHDKALSSYGNWIKILLNYMFKKKLREVARIKNKYVS